MKETMKRKRRTVSNETDSLQRIAEEIKQLKLKVEAGEGLEKETQEIANEDATVVSEGTGLESEVKEDASDILKQNEKSSDNWPVEEAEPAVAQSEKEMVASVLLRCAKVLLSEVKEIGDEESNDGEREPND